MICAIARSTLAFGCRNTLTTATPYERLGFYVLDIVDESGEVALCDADDPVSHLFRHKAVVVPDNAHNGDVDIRENICGRALNRDDSRCQDQNGQHYERVGPAQS